MILLDTNIVIDLLSRSRAPEAEWSRAAYNSAAASNIVGCNLVILAEVAAGAARPDELTDDLERLRIEILDLSVDAALAAGRAFAAYRRRGGQRQAILPDFLIGAHAVVLSAPLITRDRRIASYFPDLTLITPESHP